jgi:hypothetical protein
MSDELDALLTETDAISDALWAVHYAAKCPAEMMLEFIEIVKQTNGDPVAVGALYHTICHEHWEDGDDDTTRLEMDDEELTEFLKDAAEIAAHPHHQITYAEHHRSLQAAIAKRKTERSLKSIIGEQDWLV